MPRPAKSAEPAPDARTSKGVTSALARREVMASEAMCYDYSPLYGFNDAVHQPHGFPLPEDRRHVGARQGHVVKAGWPSAGNGRLACPELLRRGGHRQRLPTRKPEARVVRMFRDGPASKRRDSRVGPTSAVRPRVCRNFAPIWALRIGRGRILALHWRCPGTALVLR